VDRKENQMSVAEGLYFFAIALVLAYLVMRLLLLSVFHI